MTGPRGSDAPEIGGLGKKKEQRKLEQPEYIEAPEHGKYFWKHTKTGELKYVPPIPKLD